MIKDRIDKYWNAYFGLKPDALRSDKVIISPHNQLSGFQGAWIFQRSSQVIISVETHWVHIIQKIISNMSAVSFDPFSKSFRELLFGTAINKIIGPCYQGYYDNVDCPLISNPKVRSISYAKESKLILKLSNTGDPEGWNNSGIKEKNDSIYGYFQNNQLVAIACIDMIKGDVGFIGIYTNPDYRGMGLSIEVVKSAVIELSNRNKVIRYQTLRSNIPAVKIAQKIGFVDYASHLAIRLNK